MLQKINILHTTSSNIWENVDGCADQYIGATAFYFLSMLYHAHYIIFDRGVRESVHGNDVVGGRNSTYKSYLSMLITTVQLPNTEINNS